MKHLYRLFLLFSIYCFGGTFLFAQEFSKLEIKNWDKKNLSSSHIRFESKSGGEKTIHLKIQLREKETWDLDTFEADMNRMEMMRKSISFFTGIKNYRFNSAELIDKDSSLYGVESLSINGEYERLNNKKIFFTEINFYYDGYFLQYKFISPESYLTYDEERSILEQLNLKELEFR